MVALDAKDVHAAVPISLFSQFYAIEAKAREDKIGPDELLARRQALSRPLMDRLAARHRDDRLTRRRALNAVGNRRRAKGKSSTR